MKKLKLLGPIASLVCAIHCIAMPLVILLFPVVSISLFVTESFDWILLMCSFAFNLTNLCFGFKKHKSLKAFKYLGIGLGLIVIAKMEHSHEKIHTHIDIFDMVMIAGAVLIIISSFINEILCRKCNVCNGHKCHE